MKISKIIAAMMLAMLMVFTPIPAQAAAVGAYDGPIDVLWPINRAAGDRGDVTVVLQGRAELWGMRRSAENVDARVGGLDVRSGVGIRCSDVPNRSSCIRVVVGNYGRTGWGGMTTWDGDRYKLIRLNTYYRMSQFLSGHEFLHGIGMDHHGRFGQCGWGQPSWASDGEIAELRRHY